MVNTISLNNPAAFTNAEALGSGAKNPVDGSLIKGNFDKIITALNALIIAYNASELEFTNNTKVFAEFNSKVPEVFFRSPVPTYIPTGLVIPADIDNPLSVVMKKQGTSLLKLFQTTSPLTITTGMNGANGIDAPLVNGGMYYCWLIGKEDGTLAGLLSQSADNPTLPDSTYVYKFRLNWAAPTIAPTGTYLAHYVHRTDVSQTGIPTASSAGNFIPWAITSWGLYSNTIQYIDRQIGSGAADRFNNYSTIATDIAANTVRLFELKYRGYPNLWLVPPECTSFELIVRAGNNCSIYVYPENPYITGSYLVDGVVSGTSSSDTTSGVSVPVRNTRRFQEIHNTSTQLDLYIRSFTLAHTNPYGV